MCRLAKAETAEAFRGGWLHTGDLGKYDEDGYLYVVGRLKDMIIRSGYNVYPREIEEVLVTHPEISLAAVIGVPDARSGEEIKAFVVLESGSTLDSETIIAWAKTRLAAYKYPRLVEIVDQLPLGPTGKILKKELRKMEAERVGRKHTLQDRRSATTHGPCPAKRPTHRDSRLYAITALHCNEGETRRDHRSGSLNSLTYNSIKSVFSSPSGREPAPA